MRIGPLGLPELLLILLVVLLIFGPRRLPEMAKGLGQSVREFRRGIKDMRDDFESEAKKDDAKGATVHASTAAATSAAPSTAPGAPAETPAAGVQPSVPAEPVTTTDADGSKA